MTIEPTLRRALLPDHTDHLRERHGSVLAVEEAILGVVPLAGPPRRGRAAPTWDEHFDRSAAVTVPLVHVRGHLHRLATP